jgi:hypothetical protein
MRPKPAPQQIERYGALWPPSTNDLSIELGAISNGGSWKGKTGQQCGLGLFEHFMNARKLIWPNRYRHRWTDLMYKNFIENDVTILMGSASSQKTSSAVEFCLLNYWCRPENTLVILSTINMEKMDIGVWAELKLLWEQGRQQHPWLAGNIVEYKRAITTDNIEEGVRHFTRGCISRPCYVGGKFVGLGVLAGVKQDYIFYVADECFPGGTMVDTPLGSRPIDEIAVGDLVLSATGCHRVTGIGNRIAASLVRIITKDGREVICTPDHPFFTQYGWEKACDLNEKHYMLSAYETMSVLQRRIRSPHETFLQRVLRLEMGPQQARDESILLGCVEEGSCEESEMAGTASQTHERKQSDAQCRDSSESNREYQSSRNLSESPRRKRYRTIESGMAAYAYVSRGNLELCHPYGYEERKWISSVLQNGFSISKPEIGHRSRWPMPHELGQSKTEGYEEISVPRGAWVDRVEVLKQNDPRFSESGPNSGRCRVYNLQVESHPSYSVNGFVVHNCQFMAPAFSGSWPHLFANGHTKIIAAGNPKHDPEDELGKTAEPKNGWNSMPEPQKTEVWDTKFMGAKCINLVGTDSPNFDVPEGQKEPYPKLISRQFANRIEHDYGKDSFEYYKLIKGVMRIAFAESRVITRQLCREHRALEQVKWKNDKRTKVYGLDPSYGGEDRCVGMPLEFGEDVDGILVLKVWPYIVYRLDISKDTPIEYQIAEETKKQLDIHEIDARNCFYDAGGKGTLGSGFSAIFGSMSPVPVDSGARPTNRPVRQDLFIDEKNGNRRLKRCDEHYSKFVSEMWYSVRHMIEANQLRELPEDVMVEGCARIWTYVAGNKISVEPKTDPKKKEDLKRRLGKSPDLFDCLVIGVEGARQRGFTIARLGKAVDGDDDAFEWLAEMRKKHEKMMESKRLSYA